MGLNEKRIIKEYKETRFPKWIKEFNKIVGKEVEMDVQWETMTEEGRTNEPTFYFDCWTKVYFDTLSSSMAEICKDSLGKDSLGKILKKITVSGTTGSGLSSDIKFENGHLMLLHEPFTDVDSIKERVNKITQVLDKHL